MKSILLSLGLVGCAVSSIDFLSGIRSPNIVQGKDNLIGGPTTIDNVNSISPNNLYYNYYNPTPYSNTLNPTFLSGNNVGKCSPHICPSQLTSKQLIKNGNFSKNACLSQSCTWVVPNYNFYVDNWEGHYGVKVGYTKDLIEGDCDQRRAIDLDAPKFKNNGCIKQDLYLYGGQYQIRYQWGAKKGAPFQSSKLSLYMNENLIKSHTPVDYKLHTQSYPIRINACGTNQQQVKNYRVQIKFCGQGQNDGMGAVITKISLSQPTTCVSKNKISS